MITIGALNFEYYSGARFNIGKVNVDVFCTRSKIYAKRQITLTIFCRNFNGRAKRCWVAAIICSLPNINGITSKHILMDQVKRLVKLSL
jgi:hypothetical protein